MREDKGKISERIKAIESGGLGGSPDFSLSKKRKGRITSSVETDAIILAQAGVKPSRMSAKRSKEKAMSNTPIALLLDVPMESIAEMIADKGPRETAKQIGVSAPMLMMFMQSDPTRQDMLDRSLKAAANLMVFDSVETIAENSYKGTPLSGKVDSAKLSGALRRAAQVLMPTSAKGKKQPPVIIVRNEEAKPGSVMPRQNQNIDTGGSDGRPALALPQDGSINEEV